MSISEFINRTKTKALNFAEARRTAVASERKRQLSELQVKNEVLRAEASERDKLRKLKEDNRKLRMQRLTSAFGGLGNDSSKGKRKVANNTGFKSPFANSGLNSGNSPFSPGNISKKKKGGLL